MRVHWRRQLRLSTHQDGISWGNGIASLAREYQQCGHLRQQRAGVEYATGRLSSTQHCNFVHAPHQESPGRILMNS